MTVGVKTNSTLVFGTTRLRDIPGVCFAVFRSVVLLQELTGLKNGENFPCRYPVYSRHVLARKASCSMTENNANPLKSESRRCAIPFRHVQTARGEAVKNVKWILAFTRELRRDERTTILKHDLL